MLVTVKQVKEAAEKVKKEEANQLDQEIKRMRKSIVKGCGELMAMDEVYASLRCDLTIFAPSRKDLHERLRVKLAKELAESEFRDTGVRLSDGSEYDGVPCLIIKLNWAHFKEEQKTKVGNVLHECAICLSVTPMSALIPCGHICCESCNQGSQCPFCRCELTSCVALYNAADNSERKRSRTA